MKLRILHIISQLSYSGGIENYVVSCVKENQNGHISSICTFLNENNESILEELNYLGVNVFPLKRTFIENILNSYLRLIFKNSGLLHILKYQALSKLLIQHSFDIIIAHGEDAELICGFLKNFITINVIHGESYFPLNPIFRLILNRIGRRKFVHTIIVCDGLKNQLPKNYNTFTVIHSGINLERFKNIDRKYDRKSHIIKIGYIGRICKEKGVPNLLQAAKKLLNMRDDFKLLIAGGGNRTNEIMKGISNLDFTNKIEYLGEINNSHQFYQNVDVCILPSVTEGLPLAIIEAMASGAIVIATDVGCVSEIIIHEYNGFLLSDNSVNSIFSKLNDVMNNIKKYDGISQNAKKTAEKYSNQKFMKSFIDSIENVYLKNVIE